MTIQGAGAGVSSRVCRVQDRATARAFRYTVSYAPPMKVVLAAYGTRGDTEPFAALARELLRRGHDVCMAVAPEMVGFVELAGLAAVPFGPDSLASSPNPSPQDPASAMAAQVEYLSRAMREWGTTLTSLTKGAD